MVKRKPIAEYKKISISKAIDWFGENVVWSDWTQKMEEGVLWYDLGEPYVQHWTVIRCVDWLDLNILKYHEKFLVPCPNYAY